MTALPPSPARRRRVLLAVAAAAVVTATVVAVVSAGSGDGGDAPGAAAGATTAAPTSAATPSGGVVPVTAAPTSVVPAPVTPEPAGDTSDADAPPPSLAAVPLDAPAAVGNGITAAVDSLEAIDGTATGPGNVAGPALRATVRITNGTDAPVSLDAVSVELATGPALDPASPLDDASEAPFSGTVAPGGSAQGVYVFSVPTADRDSVTLTVGYQAGAPLLVFTGPAA